MDLPLDDTPDPCEAPLLAPGSDGLVQGDSRQILEQLSQYREEGHSMARIRRDFALHPRVTNSQIAGAAEYGRKLRLAGGDWVRAATRVPPPARVYSLGCPWKKEREEEP